MNQQSIGNYRWTICALLFFATTVNYLDRQVLSLLSPQLSKEFGWTNSDYANITAVFQFVYAISMIFAGRIVDKLGTKVGYQLAIFVWSLGAVMHAYAVPLGELTNNVLALAGIAAVPVSIVGFMLSRACWPSARRVTSLLPLKPRLNISLKKSARSQPVCLTQVLT